MSWTVFEGRAELFAEGLGEFTIVDPDGDEESDTWAARDDQGRIVAYRYWPGSSDGQIGSAAVYSSDPTVTPTRLLAIVSSNLASDGPEIEMWLEAFMADVLPQLTSLTIGINHFVAEPYFEMTVEVDIAAKGALFVFRPYGTPQVDLEPFRPLTTF